MVLIEAGERLARRERAAVLTGGPAHIDPSTKVVIPPVVQMAVA